MDKYVFSDIKYIQWYSDCDYDIFFWAKHSDITNHRSMHMFIWFNRITKSYEISRIYSTWITGIIFNSRYIFYKNSNLPKSRLYWHFENLRRGVKYRRFEPMENDIIILLDLNYSRYLLQYFTCVIWKLSSEIKLVLFLRYDSIRL